MQQLAFLVNSGADFEAARKGTVMERGPFVDMRHDTYKVGLSNDHTEKKEGTTQLQSQNGHINPGSQNGSIKYGCMASSLEPFWLLQLYMCVVRLVEISFTNLFPTLCLIPSYFRSFSTFLFLGH